MNCEGVEKSVTYPLDTHKMGINTLFYPLSTYLGTCLEPPRSPTTKTKNRVQRPNHSKPPTTTDQPPDTKRWIKWYVVWACHLWPSPHHATTITPAQNDSKDPMAHFVLLLKLSERMASTQSILNFDGWDGHPQFETTMVSLDWSKSEIIDDAKNALYPISYFKSLRNRV